MKLAVVGLLLALAACKAPDTTEADKKAVRDMEAAWQKAATAKDADAYVAYYADDAQVLMPNAPMFTGKAAIKETLKPMMADPNFALAQTPLRLEVSGNLAYTQGSYKMTFSDIRGNKFEDEGKYLTVYRKLADGTWKAVEDTMMSDLPLPPPE
jgi:uncharacterized protein (TIGR02246 family)